MKTKLKNGLKRAKAPTVAFDFIRSKLIGTCVAVLTIASLPSGASAGDFVFGLGQDNIDGDGSANFAGQIEYQFNPFHQFDWGHAAVIGVLEGNEESDIFAGAGVALIWNANEKWFVEGSLAAGYYDAGSDGVDLGGDVQFRSLIGLGYRLSDKHRISIAVDHLSNAGLESPNPGKNSVFLRFATSF